MHPQSRSNIYQDKRVPFPPALIYVSERTTVHLLISSKGAFHPQSAPGSLLHKARCPEHSVDFTTFQVAVATAPAVDLPTSSPSLLPSRVLTRTPQNPPSETKTVMPPKACVVSSGNMEIADTASPVATGTSMGRCKMWRPQTPHHHLNRHIPRVSGLSSPLPVARSRRAHSKCIIISRDIFKTGIDSETH